MAFRAIETYPPEAVSDFQSLKGKGGYFERGIFIAESAKIARKMLETALEVPKAYMTREHLESLRDVLERRSGTTEVYLAEKPQMEQVIGYHLHQGVMLAASVPASRSIEEAARAWPKNFLVVALDSIADPENMGAIIRTAAAFGARAIVVDGQSCNPYLRRSVRVSMGTIVDIEIIRVDDLAAALEELRALTNAQIVGAALGPTSVPLASLAPAMARVAVFGSEGWGIRPEVAKVCDVLVEIPISERVDSLNVVVASGIFLYALSRA